MKKRATLFFCAFVFLHCFLVAKSQATDFSCPVQPGQAQTRSKLEQLRTHLRNNNLNAYVIFSEDEHQSEYVQLYDERRAWITGFLGSAGTAVVTLDKAALWTDGRYWTQAEQELDCQNWLLMRSGRSGVPSLSSWLSSELMNTASPARVGIAAQFVSSSWWSGVNNVLKNVNASLVETAELIDLIWKVPERPAATSKTVNIHPLKYSGVTWQQKVTTIVRLIEARKADAYLVTALDEIAWLFNVRGSDIPYNPFFKVYRLIFFHFPFLIEISF